MYQQNTFMKRLTVAFGITMALVMAFSVILPVIAPQTQPVQSINPTAAPLPTFPAPPDPSTISFDSTFLHPTGLYSVAEPTGWLASQPNVSQGGAATTTMVNADALSIIQVELDRSLDETDAPLTLDDVDARYNQAYLASSWAQYGSWSESQRTREGDNLVLDFALTLNNQRYVSRQKAWTDGDWFYSVRVVAPDNASNTLVHVLDGVADSLTPNKQFLSSPFHWASYFDSADQYIIRYPHTWSLTDSAPGRPTSLTAEGNIALRVETAEAAITDEAAAREWVESTRAGVSVVSVEPITREGAEGFSVAYSATTADGDSQSGLVVLLNDAAGKLYTANLRFPQANVDLNNDEDRASYSDLVDVMNSFNLLPQASQAEATADAPEAEATEEAEADAETEVIVTEEATEEADTDSE